MYVCLYIYACVCAHVCVCEIQIDRVRGGGLKKSVLDFPYPPVAARGSCLRQPVLCGSGRSSEAVVAAVRR